MNLRFRLMACGVVVVAATAWGSPLYWCGMDDNATWLGEAMWSSSATPEGDGDLTAFEPGAEAVFGAIPDAVANVALSGAVTSGVVRVTETDHVFVDLPVTWGFQTNSNTNRRKGDGG